MSLRFEGDLTEFKALLEDVCSSAHWIAEPNGVHMLRCQDGVQVHWSSTKGTIWFSGAQRLFNRYEQLIRTELAFWQSDELDDEDFGLEPGDFLDDE